MTRRRLPDHVYATVAEAAGAPCSPSKAWFRRAVDAAYLLGQMADERETQARGVPLPEPNPERAE